MCAYGSRSIASAIIREMRINFCVVFNSLSIIYKLHTSIDNDLPLPKYSDFTLRLKLVDTFSA